jgi:hypothetical protein
MNATISFAHFISNLKALTVLDGVIRSQLASPTLLLGLTSCAGSSGAVHSVFLIDVYLDLKNPGGSGFWVGENRRVVGGNKERS